MTCQVIHSGNIRVMSREELEDLCACYRLGFNDTDSDQELRDAIMTELADQGEADVDT